MVDVVIRGMDERTLVALQERARRRGVAVDEVLREIVETDALLAPTPAKPEPSRLSAEERDERRRIAARMAEIRARTLKPLWADSALLIREDRDTR